MIRLVVPFYSEVETLKPSLRALRESSIAHEVQFIQGAIPAKGRNSGVSANQTRLQKLPETITHYLFVDSDIGFLVEDVKTAMNHNKMILGLPYLRHNNDGTYQASMRMSGQGELTSFIAQEAHGLCQIPFIGAGFLLVKREALEQIYYPWFHYRVAEIADAAEITGEDVGFCLTAREAGIPIFCDFDRPVYHRLRRHEHFDVSY